MFDRVHSYKPLDFGNGLVAGSVNDRGRLVSLNTCQPQYGYVTLTNMRPFPDDRWYDSAFVREYRAQQASPTLPGFGLYRLRQAGIGRAEWTRHCTYADPTRFFSYRRSVHVKEADYGRLIAAIAM